MLIRLRIKGSEHAHTESVSLMRPLINLNSFISLDLVIRIQLILRAVRLNQLRSLKN